MRRVAAVAALAIAPLAGAHETHGSEVGRVGVATAVSRTVEIVMSDDMRFTPSTIAVASGQTVRFTIRNTGKLRHEFILGSPAHIAEHAAMMREHPGMMHHDEPNAATLDGGGAGSVIWRFGAPGSVTFACLEAGHYDAGMKGTIEVRPAAPK
jgi:uncharacterized cupredoxin-like copper-binding protein